MGWVPEKEPPREVPPDVQRRVVRIHLWKFIVSAVCLGSGLVVYFVFGLFSVPFGTVGLEEAEDAVYTQGTVTRTELVRNVRSGGVHPFEIDYLFRDGSGRERRGRIWVSERSRFAELRAGDKVEVVYRRGAPEVNKIVDAEWFGMPWWVRFVGLVPGVVVAFVLTALGVFGMLGMLRILREGILAEGRIEAVKVLRYVNLGASHPAVVTVAFTDEYGQERRAKVRTIDRRVTLKEGDTCRLLYDCTEPGKAVVVEFL